MKKDKLTLATICDGQVQLMVDRALEAAGQNIADPNMDPKKVREVNISIKLAPREKDREDVKVTVAVTKKLAAEMALETNLLSEILARRKMPMRMSLAQYFAISSPYGSAVLTSAASEVK